MSPPRTPLKDISGTVLLAIVTVGWCTAMASAQISNTIPTDPAQIGATNAPTSVLRSPSSDIPPGRSGARMAQRLFRKSKYAEAAAVYEEAAKGSTRESQRDFMFNAAVAWYRAGEYAKAAAILQGLIQSRHDVDGPAARGLGSALHRRAEELDGAVDAATLKGREALLKRSAAAYQEALRAKEDNDDDRANLALVLGELPEAEEKALIAQLMQDHGQTQPFGLLETMLSEQRDILEICPQAFTNDSPGQIAQFESLAARQKANAHLWIPLKGKLLGMLQGKAGPDQLAMMNGAMDSIQDSMMDASAALRDLDAAGYGPAGDAESNLYAIWKQMADYTLLLREDLRRQSNAISRTEQAITAGTPSTEKTLLDQAEALSLTPLFVQRLPDALPEDAHMINELGPDGQPDASIQQPTDLGLTVEAHSNIVALAEEAVAAQQLALDHLQAGRQIDAMDEEMRSYDLLKQIEELLPKSPDQQQQQQDQQDQPQEQQEPQEEPPPPEEQQQEQQQPEPEPQDISQEELEKLMERALEREKEYEERQRERNRSTPLSPRERDW